MEQNLTPIEQAFWNVASERISGLVPQFWIGNYRVDFAVLEKRLVIELDGHEHHASRDDRTRDARRQRELQRDGWIVIRFTGSEIHSDVRNCVMEVERQVGLLPDFSDASYDGSSGPFHCVRMQEVVTHLFDKHGRNAAESDFYVRFPRRDCFLPLTIEKHDRSISVAHHYEMNGDIVYDPEIEFAIIEDSAGYPAWTPLAMQTVWSYRDCAELDDAGDVSVYAPEVQQDIANYAEHWARNIRANGWFDDSVLPETDP
jgi:very-short-patch-repair endonuclease